MPPVVSNRATLRLAEELLDRFFRDVEGRTDERIDVYFTLEDMGVALDRATPALEYLQSRGLLRLWDFATAMLTERGVEAVATDADIRSMPKHERAWGGTEADSESEPQADAGATRTAPRTPERRDETAPPPPPPPRPIQPQVRLIDDAGAPLVVPLGWKITLGRAETNTIPLHDARASKHHAEVVYTARGYVFRDLGSANGSMVNGAYTDGQVLSHGDEIVIGRTPIIFECPIVLVPPPRADARRSEPARSPAPDPVAPSVRPDPVAPSVRPDPVAPSVLSSESTPAARSREPATPAPRTADSGRPAPVAPSVSHRPEPASSPTLDHDAPSDPSTVLGSRSAMGVPSGAATPPPAGPSGARPRGPAEPATLFERGARDTPSPEPATLFGHGAASPAEPATVLGRRDAPVEPATVLGRREPPAEPATLLGRRDVHVPPAKHDGPLFEDDDTPPPRIPPEGALFDDDTPPPRSAPDAEANFDEPTPVPAEADFDEPTPVPAEADYDEPTPVPRAPRFGGSAAPPMDAPFEAIDEESPTQSRPIRIEVADQGPSLESALDGDAPGAEDGGDRTVATPGLGAALLAQLRAERGQDEETDGAAAVDPGADAAERSTLAAPQPRGDTTPSAPAARPPIPEPIPADPMPPSASDAALIEPAGPDPFGSHLDLEFEPDGDGGSSEARPDFEAELGDLRPPVGEAEQAADAPESDAAREAQPTPEAEAAAVEPTPVEDAAPPLDAPPSDASATADDLALGGPTAASSPASVPEPAEAALAVLQPPEPSGAWAAEVPSTVAPAPRPVPPGGLTDADAEERTLELGGDEASEPAGAEPEPEPTPEGEPTAAPEQAASEPPATSALADTASTPAVDVEDLDVAALARPTVPMPRPVEPPALTALRAARDRLDPASEVDRALELALDVLLRSARFAELLASDEND